MDLQRRRGARSRPTLPSFSDLEDSILNSNFDHSVVVPSSPPPKYSTTSDRFSGHPKLQLAYNLPLLLHLVNTQDSGKNLPNPSPPQDSYLTTPAGGTVSLFEPTRVSGFDQGNEYEILHIPVSCGPNYSKLDTEILKHRAKPAAVAIRCLCDAGLGWWSENELIGRRNILDKELKRCKKEQQRKVKELEDTRRKVLLEKEVVRCEGLVAEKVEQRREQDGDEVLSRARLEAYVVEKNKSHLEMEERKGDGFILPIFARGFPPGFTKWEVSKCLGGRGSVVSILNRISFNPRKPHKSSVFIKFNSMEKTREVLETQPIYFSSEGRAQQPYKIEYIDNEKHGMSMALKLLRDSPVISQETFLGMEGMPVDLPNLDEEFHRSVYTCGFPSPVDERMRKQFEIYLWKLCPKNAVTLVRVRTDMEGFAKSSVFIVFRTTLMRDYFLRIQNKPLFLDTQLAFLTKEQYTRVSMEEEGCLDFGGRKLYRSVFVLGFPPAANSVTIERWLYENGYIVTKVRMVKTYKDPSDEFDSEENAIITKTAEIRFPNSLEARVLLLEAENNVDFSYSQDRKDWKLKVMRKVDWQYKKWDTRLRVVKSELERLEKSRIRPKQKRINVGTMRGGAVVGDDDFQPTSLKVKKKKVRLGSQRRDRKKREGLPQIKGGREEDRGSVDTILIKEDINENPMKKESEVETILQNLTGKVKVAHCETEDSTIWTVVIKKPKKNTGSSEPLEPVVESSDSEETDSTSSQKLAQKKDTTDTVVRSLGLTATGRVDIGSEIKDTAEIVLPDGVLNEIPDGNFVSSAVTKTQDPYHGTQKDVIGDDLAVASGLTKQLEEEIAPISGPVKKPEIYVPPSVRAARAASKLLEKQENKTRSVTEKGAVLPTQLTEQIRNIKGDMPGADENRAKSYNRSARGYPKDGHYLSTRVEKKEKAGPGKFQSEPRRPTFGKYGRDPAKIHSLVDEHETSPAPNIKIESETLWPALASGTLKEDKTKGALKLTDGYRGDTAGGTVWAKPLSFHEPPVAPLVGTVKEDTGSVWPPTATPSVTEKPDFLKDSTWGKHRTVDVEDPTYQEYSLSQEKMGQTKSTGYNTAVSGPIATSLVTLNVTRGPAPVVDPDWNKKTLKGVWAARAGIQVEEPEQEIGTNEATEMEKEGIREPKRDNEKELGQESESVARDTTLLSAMENSMADGFKKENINWADEIEGDAAEKPRVDLPKPAQHLDQMSSPPKTKYSHMSGSARRKKGKKKGRAFGGMDKFAEETGTIKSSGTDTMAANMGISGSVRGGDLLDEISEENPEQEICRVGHSPDIGKESSTTDAPMANKLQPSPTFERRELTVEENDVIRYFAETLAQENSRNIILDTEVSKGNSAWSDSDDRFIPTSDVPSLNLEEGENSLNQDQLNEGIEQAQPENDTVVTVGEGICDEGDGATSEVSVWLEGCLESSEKPMTKQEIEDRNNHLIGVEIGAFVFRLAKRRRGATVPELIAIALDIGFRIAGYFEYEGTVTSSDAQPAQSGGRIENEINESWIAMRDHRLTTPWSELTQGVNTLQNAPRKTTPPPSLKNGSELETIQEDTTNTTNHHHHHHHHHTTPAGSSEEDINTGWVKERIQNDWFLKGHQFDPKHVIGKSSPCLLVSTGETWEDRYVGEAGDYQKGANGAVEKHGVAHTV